MLSSFCSGLLKPSSLTKIPATSHAHNNAQQLLFKAHYSTYTKPPFKETTIKPLPKRLVQKLEDQLQWYTMIKDIEKEIKALFDSPESSYSLFFERSAEFHIKLHELANERTELYQAFHNSSIEIAKLMQEVKQESKTIIVMAENNDLPKDD